LNVFALDIVVFAIVFPKLGSFGNQRINDDQVLELGQTGNDFLLVGERTHRVKALANVAIELALVHQLKGHQDVVALVPLGQVVKCPVVFFGSSIAPPSFLQTHKELGIVLPKAHLVGTQWLERTRLVVGLEVLLSFARQGQVAWQAL
jgi:hypothetical protein